MSKLRVLVLAAGMFALAGGLNGQEKKDAPKKEEPAAKVKGQLPANWKVLGLTEEQKQKVYAIDAKYDAEIDDLKAKIEGLKKKKLQEQLTVLTAEQKKTLEENAKKKASGG